MKWTRFEDDLPLGDWIWMSDFKRIWLTTENLARNCEGEKNIVWAEAKLRFPKLPKFESYYEEET
jgi:hypothetical protein